MKIGIQTWGSEGDIRPFAALATALASSGHEVTLVATDIAGQTYDDLARQGGFRLRAVASPVFASATEGLAMGRAVIEAANPVQQSRLLVARAFDPVEPALLRAAIALCAESDLVVGHYFVHPLRAAAEQAGVPYVAVQLAHGFVRSRHYPPHGLPVPFRWLNRVAWRLAERVTDGLLLERINRMRRSLQLPPHRHVISENWLARELNLVAVSPTLCQRAPDWPRSMVVTGFLSLPSAPEPVPDGLDRFLGQGPPPVYFCFGSLMLPEAGYLASTVGIWLEAARMAGCRAIIQVPPADGFAAPAADDRFVLPRCPHAAVFPRCAAIVHHGGAGTTQSALLAGRPSIVVAHVADQFFWGDVLRRAGVAPAPLKRRTLTAHVLARRIREVLAGRPYAKRASSLGERMRGEDGPASAVAAIEDLIGRAPTASSRLSRNRTGP
jgi:UDP:flavonoid glycosyltransferase YjiC (YdhE family)